MDITGTQPVHGPLQASLQNSVSSVSRVLRTTHPTKSCAPRLTMGSTTNSIKVFGYHLMLDGFRFMGCATSPDGPQMGIPHGIEVAYDQALVGFSMPCPTEAPDQKQFWVACQAIEPGEASASTAQITFIPFMRVIEYDPTTRTVSCYSNVGKIVNGFFDGGMVMLCQEGGRWSGRIAQVMASSYNATKNTNELVLSSDAALQAGDYLELSVPGRSFRHLRSLKADASAIPTGAQSNPGPVRFDWRSFVTEGADVFSHVGPLPTEGAGGINSTAFTPLDFRHFVSPLATGVIGNILVANNTNPANGKAVTLTLSVDGVSNSVASISNERAWCQGDGVQATFRAPFHSDAQFLYGKVDAESPEYTAKIVITGWTEPVD
eukprot:TRINITY_DN54830_c0_g1_i1.p1 TRINITY_DN54830_c0_g1~~TRINITY_DN54830_c0_g1_i1.p1  ORF type:complete len:443 (+),score=42.05 TRINITY_DN54830_c0_g1_i1:200-1330(+)